jgi:hypothetical protein
MLELQKASRGKLLELDRQINEEKISEIQEAIKEYEARDIKDVEKLRSLENEKRNLLIEQLKLRQDISEIGNIIFDKDMQELESAERRFILEKTYDSIIKDRLQETYDYEGRIRKIQEDNSYFQNRGLVTTLKGIQLIGIEKNIQDYITAKREEREAVEERRLNTLEKETKLEAVKFELEKDSNWLAKDTLAVEKQSLDLQMKDLQARLNDSSVAGDPNKRREVLDEINKKQLEINKNLYNQRLLLNPIEAAYKNIKKEVQDWHELTAEQLTNFYKGLGSGIGSTTWTALWGFQEQEQEVINLRGELAELQKEYDNLYDEDLSTRGKEITEEMTELKNKINELEDPIHNLSESFRIFFKNLIDQIGEAITQWLAMQIVMMGVSLFSAGAAAGVGARPEAGMAFGLQVAAHGGLLPSIRAFRQFSRGGLTGRPTLALLGDNSSGTELVIPQENIKQDNVSGYTRKNDQPINILNIITEDDLANTLARSASGQQVIINTIGRDLAKKGSTFRQIRA